MPALLLDLYNKTEKLTGKKLALVVLLVFAIFIPTGIFIGNNIPLLLNKSEMEIINSAQELEVVQAKSYTGKVRYVDPKLYPQDNISFELVDDQNNEIILLKAYDQKLSVVEGLSVVLFGDLRKTVDNSKDVLIVEKVVVKN